uniref:Spatacsin C-terminal domain-containing protein n=1 Tax=Strigamia maritima TaxID=126957 RepID=T1ILE3_STRMM
MEEFRVCKWECEKNFLLNSLIKLSPNFNVVVILTKRTLNTYCLKQSSWLRSIDNVVDFCFEDNTKDKSRVLILNEDGLLVLNDISDVQISKISEFSLEKDLHTLQFLGFFSGFASILSDKTSVLVINVEGNSKSTLDLNKIFNKNGQIENNFRLKNAETENKHPHQFFISTDENFVAVLYKDGSCLFFKITKSNYENVIHIKSQSKSIPKLKITYWDVIQKNTNLRNNDEIIKKFDEDYLLTLLSPKSSFKNKNSKSLIEMWDFMPSGYQIENLEISFNFVFLYCSGEETKKLLLVERKNGKLLDSINIKNDNIFLFGANNGNPNLILSNDYISVLIYLPKQEILLNKMMVYSDTPLADKILQLNSWHNVALPLTFLDWGLHNHQLGLVAVYLNSQRKAWNGNASIHEKLELNNEMMNLIFSVIGVQSHSSTFVEQILKLTLQYLISLLMDSSENCSGQDEFQQFIVYFMKKARHFLKPPISHNNSYDELENLEDNVDVTPENVNLDLCESLMERRLPQLQNSLRKLDRTNSLKELTVESKDLVMQFVVSRDIKMARTLLNNLGIDADAHLQSVSEVIIHRELREFLFNQLPLSDEFLSSVNSLRKLEECYPSTLSSRSKDELLLLTPNWNINIIDIESPSTIPEVSWNNEDLNDEQTNTRSPFYSNLALHWVQRMTSNQINFSLFDRAQTDVPYWWIEWHHRLSRNEIDFNNWSIPLPISLDFINQELDHISCLPLTRELVKIHLTRLGCVNRTDVLQRTALASTLSCNTCALKYLIEICNEHNYTNIIYEFNDDVNLLLGADTSPTLRLINTFLEDGSVVVACFDQVSMFVNANSSKHVLDSLIADYPFAAAYCFALPNCKSDIKEQLRPVLNHPRISIFLQHYLSEDTVSFNITRLFAKNSSEDTENCIPSPFITETQHEVTLEFMYYLKQSRPCFAYLQFLLQEGNRSNKLNRRRLQTACALATSLAFSNSQSPSICASCTVFIELLNMSSEWLRLNLEAVSFLGKNDIVIDHSNVDHLVSALEDNLKCEQPSENVAACFLQKLQMFKVLVKICQLCKLEMPIKRLYEWDWLLTLVIAQQCNYNVSKIRSVFNNWKQKEVTEHIQMALQQTRMEQKKANQIKSSVRRGQTSRDVLYRKLGLVECQRKPVEVKDESRSESPMSLLSEEFITPSDLLQNVIVCYDSQNIDKTFCAQSVSWKNPLFAVLCTGQSDTKSCLLAWVSSVLRVEAEDFNSVIQIAFGNCWWSLILSRGCRLFKQELLPLDLFFNSLNLLFNLNEYDTAVSKEDLNEMTLLVWHTIESIFKLCSSQFKIYEFLKVLHATNFTSVFHRNVDFGILSCLQQHVLTTSVSLPYNEILNSEDFSCLSWSKTIIEDLLNANHVQEAEKVQEITELQPNNLIVFHLHSILDQLEHSQKWKHDAKMRLNFWSYCSKMYLNHEIPSDLSAEFFKKCSEKVLTQSEKFYLLKLAFKSQPEDVNLEREMWLRRIKAQLLNEDCKNFLNASDPSTVPALCTKASILNKFQKVPVKGQQIDDEESMRAVKEIISRELDRERILDALRISAFFEHEDHNLKLVLICMDLAEGTVRPENVNLDEFQTRRLLLRKNSNPENSLAELFEKIIYFCKHGRSYCNRIFSYYKVSELLGISYSVTVEHKDVFSLVKSLLKKKTIEGISLAKQLCSDNCISKERIVQFICDEVTSLMASTNFDDVTFEESKAFLHFKELMKLISDTSLVGSQLIDLSKNEILSLGCRVELIIWAHFCFSSSCNTEGIAMVLHHAHQLTTMMDVSHSALAVRLLTGIERYNEMLYVFDLLMEWDQFELLLKKGMDKLYFFKTSLLDYLWRFRHTDVQRFMMTAVRFCLYREMGDMIHSTAKKQMEQASGEQDFDQILQDLAEAAESYSKAGCHRHAQKCCRLAELVALQVYFLPSDKRILGLREEQVDKFISYHPEFYESYLVSCAYEAKTDWATAIYFIVVIGDNLEYLKQFHNCLGMSKDVAEKIVARLEKEKSPTDNMMKNCACIIELLEDVRDAFPLSRRIKSDLTERLTKSESGPFIRDAITHNLRMF